MRRGGDEQRPEDVLMFVPGIGYLIVAPRGEDGLSLQPL